MAEEKQIREYVEKHKGTLDYNSTIFDILEGNLLKHLKMSLAQEFKPKNLADAMTRANPTNILRKVVNKLSRLYLQDPKRTTDNDVNQDLIDMYVENEDLNFHWNDANVNFNAYKNSALELFYDDNVRRLRTRAVPSTSFLPRSTSFIDPLTPTEVIKLMGKDQNGNPIVWVYTNEDFYSVNMDGSKMSIGETEGENPYGIMPFTYINQSSYTLIPTIDTDTVQLALLTGKLLTDINFSSKYNANPIVYGIDLEMESLERSPNILWDLKSSPDKKPELNVIKPESDLEGMMTSLEKQVALWLQSKDIRPGTVGDAGSGDRAASGLSLMIQEMDTTENVNKQKRYFEAAENDYWKRLGMIHNYLADSGQLEIRERFVDPETMTVAIEYPEQKTIEDKTAVETRILNKFTQGAISLRKAVEELYPKFDESEVQELVDEIKESRTISFGEIQTKDNGEG